MTPSRRFTLLPLGLTLVILALVPGAAFAHCDSMDGPVVKAAMAALEQGNANLVLIWVKEEYEAEVRGVLERTLVVRQLGGEAKALADRYFFEAVVRLHRMGEGEPYTGLKPAGRDLGPAIPAADRALETGELGPLLQLLREELEAGVAHQLEQVLAAKPYGVSDVAAGRRFVERYVVFVHYVEALHQATARDVHGHYPERAEATYPGGR